MKPLDARSLNGYDVTTMREIGVRELKAKLSEVLRSIEAGESIRVTNHGKPVAEITPPREQTFEGRMRELEAQGLVTRPRVSGPPPPFEPVELPDGVEGGSAMILAERDSYYDDEM